MMRGLPLWYVLLGLSLSLVACDESSPPPSPAPSAAAPASTAAAATIDPDDPKSCAPCHGAIVTEWEESMHARAHESRDPIFAGMRSLRMKKEGEAVAGKCATCHYPRARGDAAIAAHGVNCASCHQVAAIHQGRGPGGKALAWSEDGVMAGPHDIPAGASPVHATGPAPAFMKDGVELCLACHEGAKNPQGVPTCTTGAEYAAAADAASCVSCHMPEVATPSGSVTTRTSHRSHTFVGPHRAWTHDDVSFLASAVELTATIEGGTVVVTLRNRSPHAFPSGFPGRMAVVVATAGDWKSAPDTPMKDTPQAVLFKTYVDEDGKPVPAPFAAKLAEDTRLKVGETRSIRLEGVPPGAETAEVSLLFSLLPPPLAEVIGVDGPTAKPRVVARATATRRR